MLFTACLRQLRIGKPDDTRKNGAAITLQVFMRSMLSKNLAGWEVMEVFAGDVGASDGVFMVGPCSPLEDSTATLSWTPQEYATIVDEVLGNAAYPRMFVTLLHCFTHSHQRTVSLRHAILQSCVVFMCGINQLSPGACIIFPSTSMPNDSTRRLFSQEKYIRFHPDGRNMVSDNCKDLISMTQMIAGPESDKYTFE